MANYNAQAVSDQIARDRRAGRRISGKEAKLIHALLRGREPAPSKCSCSDYQLYQVGCDCGYEEGRA